MQPKLAVEDLSVSWEDMPVCENISFNVAPGQIVCMVGKSGSGKTTLFHALAGLTKPDAGRILLDGEDVTGVPGYVGYMLQKDLLIEQHTVLDDVCMPLRIKGAGKREAREEASAHFAEFGIEGTQHKYPSQLSGGMRQRAALLRTYMMGRDVVLLDEPFSALDSLTRMDMRAWLLDMVTRLGWSVLLVTHDVEEAIFLADKVVVLSGDPQAGIPSTIAGQVEIDCYRSRRQEFLMESEALEIKRCILELLKL